MRQITPPQVRQAPLASVAPSLSSFSIVWLRCYVLLALFWAGMALCWRVLGNAPDFRTLVNMIGLSLLAAAVPLATAWQQSLSRDKLLLNRAGPVRGELMLSLILFVFACMTVLIAYDPAGALVEVSFIGGSGPRVIELKFFLVLLWVLVSTGAALLIAAVFALLLLWRIAGRFAGSLVYGILAALISMPLLGGQQVPWLVSFAAGESVHAALTEISSVDEIFGSLPELLLEGSGSALAALIAAMVLLGVFSSLAGVSAERPQSKLQPVRLAAALGLAVPAIFAMLRTTSWFADPTLFPAQDWVLVFNCGIATVIGTLAVCAISEPGCLRTRPNLPDALLLALCPAFWMLACFGAIKVNTASQAVLAAAAVVCLFILAAAYRLLVLADFEKPFSSPLSSPLPALISLAILFFALPQLAEIQPVQLVEAANLPLWATITALLAMLLASLWLMKGISSCWQRPYLLRPQRSLRNAK